MSRDHRKVMVVGDTGGWGASCGVSLVGIRVSLEKGVGWREQEAAEETRDEACRS